MCAPGPLRLRPAAARVATNRRLQRKRVCSLHRPCTPARPAPRSNRSLALLKLNKLAKALADAEQCTRLDPANVKGWYRQSQVLEAQGQLEQVRQARLQRHCAAGACKLAARRTALGHTHSHIYTRNRAPPQAISVLKEGTEATVSSGDQELTRHIKFLTRKLTRDQGRAPGGTASAAAGVAAAAVAGGGGGAVRGGSVSENGGKVRVGGSCLRGQWEFASVGSKATAL